MFKGSSVALVTPMKKTGEVDEKAMVSLVKWHLAKGTAAIVVVGTTGESATLTPKEQDQVIGLVCETVDKKIPVIAGTGTNATASTIARTKAAQAMGAKASLMVTPYYNRPTQTGLIEHYRAVCDVVDLPILLYNVPKRTGCDLLPETVALLSERANVIGLKEATGDLKRLSALQAVCQPDFLFYSGDDMSALAFMQAGGQGVISVVANIVPSLVQKMCTYVFSDQIEKAQVIDKTLQKLNRLLMAEPNPIPVKWVLHYLQKIESGIRLPLTLLSKQQQQAGIEILHEMANVIQGE